MTALTTQRHRSWRGTRRTAGMVVLVLVGIGWIYPFLWMVSTAFKLPSEIFNTGLFPTSITLDNFVHAWWDANVARNFFNTVVITVVTVIIVVLTSAMIGYALGRYRFPGRKVIFGVLVASVFVPEGYTIIPVFQLVTAMHLDNSLAGIILAEAGGGHVLYILLFASFFSQLPQELTESATMDGAGYVRMFVSIMVPLAKPMIATISVLQFMASWNNYFLPLVLTLSRPELQTLGVGMQSFKGEFMTDWGGLAAAATISQIPIIAVFLLLQRYFVDGFAGAVKS